MSVSLGAARISYEFRYVVKDAGKSGRASGTVGVTGGDFVKRLILVDETVEWNPVSSAELKLV